MGLTMHIYNTKQVTQLVSRTEGFDISEIVHNIEYTTSILGQAGKLTFTIEKDPNNLLEIKVGSLVKFWHSDKDKESEGDKPVFMGNVFTIGTDRTEAYKVVAYDQLRYLKNHEYMSIPEYENNLQYYFNKFAQQYSFTKSKIVNWNKYIKESGKIKGQVFNDVSAFEILQYCMNEYSIVNTITFNTSNANIVYADRVTQQLTPKFYLRDNFGTVELREMLTDLLYDDNGMEKKEFLVIGDESLLTDYQFEVDIDKNTFNEFYIMFSKKEDNAKNESTNTQVEDKNNFVALQAGSLIQNTGTILDGQRIGESTIPKWGTLRKIVTLNQPTLKGDAVNYVQRLMLNYNQPSRSVKLTALGYDGVYAGSSFIFSLNKLKINYPVYVISATHHYNGDSHTMELEVNSNVSMEMFV